MASSPGMGVDVFNLPCIFFYMEVRIDIVFCEFTSRNGQQFNKNILARYVFLGGV